MSCKNEATSYLNMKPLSSSFKIALILEVVLCSTIITDLYLPPSALAAPTSTGAKLTAWVARPLPELSGRRVAPVQGRSDRTQPISSQALAKPTPLVVLIGLDKQAKLKALLEEWKRNTQAPRSPFDPKPPVLFVADAQAAGKLGVAPGTIAALAVDGAGWVRRVSFFGDAKTVETHAERLAPWIKDFYVSREFDPVGVRVGERAPDFSMPDMNGKMRRLRDARGKKSVLLTFFPQCFTFNCANQLQSLRDVAPQLEAADVEVWGVSVDAAEGARGQRAFVKHLNLPFPLLPDTARNLCLLYGTVQSRDQMAGRCSILIDKNGVVQMVDWQVHPQTHGADLLERLKEGNAKPEN